MNVGTWQNGFEKWSELVARSTGSTVGKTSKAVLLHHGVSFCLWWCLYIHTMSDNYTFSNYHYPIELQVYCKWSNLCKNSFFNRCLFSHVLLVFYRGCSLYSVMCVLFFFILLFDLFIWYVSGVMCVCDCHAVIKDNLLTYLQYFQKVNEGWGARYCDEHVCLFICLFVCLLA